MKYLFLIILTFTLSAVSSQTLKRTAISFYGSTSAILKSTSGQVSSGSVSTLSALFVTGFQQPLSFPNDVRLNVLSDTILCYNDKITLLSGKCAFYKWFRNDTLINGQVGNSILINQPGTYKVVGSDGISKFDTSKAIKFSYLAKPNKPILVNYSSDTTVCFYDTLSILSAKVYDKYKWSSGDTLAGGIIVRTSGTYFLQAGTRAGNSSNYCYSDTSVIITARKNLTPIPSIIRISDDLVSSLSQNYRWYQNNLQLPQAISSSFHLINKGIYRVETSNDNFCWSTSSDYIVQTDPSSADQKDFQLIAFPNPTNGIFFLQIKLDRRISGFVQIKIADASGTLKWAFNKFVFSDMNFKIPMNLNFNKGVYTVQVSINGYKTKTIQVIGL